MAISKKLRQRNNENAAKYFASAFCGFIALFIIFHWTRLLYKRCGLSKKRTGGVLKLPVAFTRLSRQLLTRKVPGFPSAGHNLVFLGYIVTNLCITFTEIDWTNLVGLSKRLGWVTVSNLSLVMFLSLKNTPLAFMTAYSYEHLQPLHQIAGYTTIATWFMHAMIYITAWDYSHTLHEMLEKDQIMGIIGGISLLLLLLTTLLRKWHYELFHIVHSLLAVLILIMAGLHRPNLVQKSSYAIIFCGAIWGLDRLIRTVKLSIYGVGNKATLTPLPHGGTKIVLKKAPKGAKAGKHIWLHLPCIRKIELHPFTIVSTDPLELVVAAQDGFTRDLHDHAVKNPGVEISASVDGPYGSVLDFYGLDKVVFIAGGSGGSYTAGVAVDLLRVLGDDEGTVVEFVWVVRHTEMLAWFSPHLAELSSSPRVNMRIHVTHHSYSPSSPSISGPDEISSTPPEYMQDPEKDLPSPSSPQSMHDPEKILPSLTRELHTLDGRPNIPALVRNTVVDAEKGDRLAVVACGPGGMMLDVRKAVADNLRAEGPSLELWSEHFGW
ncbi:related to ferric-chelate reductase [Phialocephala subalpina]|uniref:Related to ferric-chelate reductase n=1 Tax=Phialocephala subalpina TaxID=576137 RepID=A0A1L7WHQ0_9HELO|nr:related to ferric-chelate reductase [Phialocephala subalpina]